MANKMGIWLLMITITILFGSLGLGYMLTTSSEGAIKLPSLFYVNTAILLVSSVLLHVGWVNRLRQGKPIIIWPSMLLGIVFLVSQLFCWVQLYQSGLTLNQGGIKISYLYVLTGLHGLHIIGGLLFLLFVGMRFEDKGKKYVETAVFFWHFLGILWLYLLIMMLLG